MLSGILFKNTQQKYLKKTALGSGLNVEIHLRMVRRLGHASVGCVPPPGSLIFGKLSGSRAWPLLGTSCQLLECLLHGLGHEQKNRQFQRMSPGQDSILSISQVNTICTCQSETWIKERKTVQLKIKIPGCFPSSAFVKKRKKKNEVSMYNRMTNPILCFCSHIHFLSFPYNLSF